MLFVNAKSALRTMGVVCKYNNTQHDRTWLCGEVTWFCGLSLDLGVACCGNMLVLSQLTTASRLTIHREVLPERMRPSYENNAGAGSHCNIDKEGRPSWLPGRVVGCCVLLTIPGHCLRLLQPQEPLELSQRRSRQNAIEYSL